MKKIYIATILASVLLFSACVGGKESTPEDSSVMPESPSIDITYLSYDDNIDWASTNYKYGESSFEMPASWQVVDGMEEGLVNGIFLVPPGTDMDNLRFSAHVAIEVIGGAPEGANVPDFSSESIQKEFFASQIISTYSKMGGLSDLEFLVWESEYSYVYIATFKRSNDALTMYQTTYYVMSPDITLSVNASHFGEDSTPDVNETARHLINTFSVQ